jgi:predicted nucleic acid-binding Zn ribbon protein
MNIIESKQKKYRVRKTLKKSKNKDTELYINNESCSNKKTKKEFELLNKKNNLCICCGEIILDINNCNECPNFHKFHNICKDKIIANIITHKACPICGLLINRKCKTIEDKNGGKILKHTIKRRKNKKQNKKIKY